MHSVLIVILILILIALGAAEVNAIKIGIRIRIRKEMRIRCESYILIAFRSAFRSCGARSLVAKHAKAAKSAKRLREGSTVEIVILHPSLSFFFLCALGALGVLGGK